MFSNEDELDRARLRIARLERIRKAWKAGRVLERKLDAIAKEASELFDGDDEPRTVLSDMKEIGLVIRISCNEETQHE